MTCKEFQNLEEGLEYGGKMDSLPQYEPPNIQQVPYDWQMLINLKEDEKYQGLSIRSHECEGSHGLAIRI